MSELLKLLDAEIQSVLDEYAQLKRTPITFGDFLAKVESPQFSELERREKQSGTLLDAFRSARDVVQKYPDKV